MHSPLLSLSSLAILPKATAVAEARRLGIPVVAVVDTNCDPDLVDYPMNYHVTGSVRLGHSRERLQEFKRVVGMGRYQGMDLSILGPEEIRSKYPFVETHDLTGALYDPYDGDIDPAQLTQALAAGARQMGARIERFCPVTAARWTGSEWVLSTPKGEVRADADVELILDTLMGAYAWNYRLAAAGRADHVDMTAIMERQIRLIFHGLLPR